MKRLHIFNPAAGKGHSPELLTKGAANGEESYITSGIGDAERYVMSVCETRPETHFIVYGGDGTVNEAANGIIKAGAGNKCLLSVVPAGTGNDLLRSFPEKGRVYNIDALKYRFYKDKNFAEPVDERYSVNILNFGFDGRVVKSTNSYKKFFHGSAAYIAGVVDTLCRGIGEPWNIELVDENGEAQNLDGQFTLALAANCKYYGGGFRAAPLADPSDGLIDVVAVKKVSRMTFIKLVSDYKKGTYIDPLTRTPYDKFKSFVTYKRCRSLKICGISQLCCDGELQEAGSLEVTTVPQVLRIST